MKAQLSSRHWVKVLQSLGLEFWLPLPLLGLVFWLGTGFVGEQILTRSLEMTKTLQIDTQSARQLTKTVIAISAEIRRQEGFSRVRGSKIYLGLTLLSHIEQSNYNIKKYKSYLDWVMLLTYPQHFTLYEYF